MKTVLLWAWWHWKMRPLWLQPHCVHPEVEVISLWQEAISLSQEAILLSLEAISLLQEAILLLLEAI